jgi:hypothetical protein
LGNFFDKLGRFFTKRLVTLIIVHTAWMGGEAVLEKVGMNFSESFRQETFPAICI